MPTFAGQQLPQDGLTVPLVCHVDDTQVAVPGDRGKVRVVAMAVALVAFSFTAGLVWSSLSHHPFGESDDSATMLTEWRKGYYPRNIIHNHEEVEKLKH